MDKEVELQTLCNQYLTESNSGNGIKSAIGSTNNLSFKLSSEILNNRKTFWDEFFKKYTEKSFEGTDKDLNDPYASGPYKKSLRFIQHWIDNGTFPHENNVDIVKQVEQNHTKARPENSSSSSVNTITYILSNMNTTKKVDAAAIIEGAKRNTLLNIENEDLHSIKTVVLNRNNVYKSNDGNSVQQSSKTNSSMIPLIEDENDVIFERFANPKIDITQVQEHLHAHPNDISASSHIASNQFNKELMNLISKVTKDSSVSTELNECSQSNMSEQNSMWQNHFTKLTRRKKLYSSRDSPIDIVFTNTRNEHITPKAKKCLHPALNAEYKIRGYKYLSKKKAQKMRMLHMSMITNSMLSLASENRRKRKSITKVVNKQKTKLNSIDANNTVIEQINHNIASEFDDSVKDVTLFKEPDHTVTIFKKPKLVVRSRKLSTSDLLKQQKSNEVIALQKLKPVVYLKQLSETEIKKYMKPKRLTVYCDKLLNPIVRLNRLSESDIQKYKKAGKIDRNVQNTQTQNNDVKKISHSQDTSNNLLQHNNTIDLLEDSDSDQSTLLIYECENPTSKKCTGNLQSANNDSQKTKLKTIDNKIQKKSRTVLLKREKTRSSQRNKEVKSNNENCGKSKETNNERSDLCIYTQKPSIRLPTNEVEIINKNNCAQRSKLKHNKKENFLILPDDSVEFIKLISKSGYVNLKNTTSTDTNNANANCKTVTHAFRFESSPTHSESSVRSIRSNKNLRNTRKNVVSQKPVNVNIGNTENYLRFQTRYDTDSEVSL